MKGEMIEPTVRLIIIRMHAAGMTVKDIAYITVVSERVIRHFISVFKKTGDYGVNRQKRPGPKLKLGNDDIQV
jgi:transposase